MEQPLFSQIHCAAETILFPLSRPARMKSVLGVDEKLIGSNYEDIFSCDVFDAWYEKQSNIEDQ